MNTNTQPKADRAAIQWTIRIAIDSGHIHTLFDLPPHNGEISQAIDYITRALPGPIPRPERLADRSLTPLEKLVILVTAIPTRELCTTIAVLYHESAKHRNTAR